MDMHKILKAALKMKEKAKALELKEGTVDVETRKRIDQQVLKVSPCPTARWCYEREWPEELVDIVLRAGGYFTNWCQELNWWSGSRFCYLFLQRCGHFPKGTKIE
jgi:hypothetical protein